MTTKRLASEIAKREGKKSQAKIGDIREVLRIIENMIMEKNMERGGFHVVLEKDDPLAELYHRACKRTVAKLKAKDAKAKKAARK